MPALHLPPDEIRSLFRRLRARAAARGGRARRRSLVIQVGRPAERDMGMSVDLLTSGERRADQQRSAQRAEARGHPLLTTNRTAVPSPVLAKLTSSTSERISGIPSPRS